MYVSSISIGVRRITTVRVATVAAMTTPRVPVWVLDNHACTHAISVGLMSVGGHMIPRLVHHGMLWLNDHLHGLGVPVLKRIHASTWDSVWVGRCVCAHSEGWKEQATSVP